MPPFTLSRSQDLATLTTPDLALVFSLDDGGLRELRRAGGPNLLGYGRPVPSIDVRIGDRGWMAGRVFIRYLRHTASEHDGAIELVITIGIGPLMIDDCYHITGTLLTRRLELYNAGEDPVHLRGVRMQVPWACAGALESCRFDAPGNQVRPQVPLLLAARYRRAGALQSLFLPQRDEYALERSPSEGPGVLSLHDPASDETLMCWYYGTAGTALPQIEGNDRALMLIHEVELAHWIESDQRAVVSAQYLLLMHEPWPNALAALQRTWPICGVRSPARPAAWVRDAAFYETHPALFGGFRGLAQALPRLRALGLNTLCLLPVWDFANPRGQLWDASWDSAGSPYALRDLDQLDATLGGPAELRDLVGAAHALGMRVVIDLPLEGCAPTSPLIGQHPGWFCYDEDSRIEHVSQHPELVAFDWDHPGLRAYMQGWALRQLREYALDGFRILPPRANSVRHRPPEYAPAGRMGVLDMLEQLRAEVKAANPAAVLLCALAGPLYAAFHDGQLDDPVHHMFMNLALRRVAPADVGDWLADYARALPPGPASICFTEHYRTRLISPLADGLRGSRASRMILAGMVLCGFVPLIRSGQEHSDGEFIGRLLHARAEYAVLREGSSRYNDLPCSSGQVFAVWRGHAAEYLLGLLNVGPHKHTVSLSLPVDQIGLADGEYELFDLFERRAWAENGRSTWGRDDLLALRLTLEPFAAYGLLVRPAARPTPPEAELPAEDAQLDGAPLDDLLMPMLAPVSRTNGRRQPRSARAGRA